MKKSKNLSESPVYDERATTRTNNKELSPNTTMHRYALLLRGINVGGSKCIKMADLKRTLANIKFQYILDKGGDDQQNCSSDWITLQNIKSYLASGNIIFELNRKLKSEDERNLEEKITSTLMKEYTFDIPVMIRHASAFKHIILQNPFFSSKEKFDHLFVCLLIEKPDNELIQTMLNQGGDLFSPDEFEIVEDCIFLRLKSAAKTKLTNTMFERKLKVNTTTRNWKTMLELKKLTVDE